MEASHSGRMDSDFHSVIVIGAGISGLYAAKALRSHFPDILVVEASNRLGGRIKQASQVKLF